MWVNLHTLPAGQSMYTVAITDGPLDMPDADRYIADEIDIVASSRASVAEVIAAAFAADGPFDSNVRVVGVSNQSAAYVMVENWEGVA